MSVRTVGSALEAALRASSRRPIDTAEEWLKVAAAGMEVIHHRTAADYPWIICAAV
jgi:hypothetical protein